MCTLEVMQIVSLFAISSSGVPKIERFIILQNVLHKLVSNDLFHILDSNVYYFSYINITTK